ncbi:MAG TPA: YggS family pyridoxal phosphate-dependent enzyme [Chitinophagaceae bacterium]|nr:YggS family pyridoxal phosphate-dependent enzyme [Chitinophagaceae bacterium]
MSVNKEKYQQINEELRLSNISLVAVSKTKLVEDILELYNLGHRDFGENYVQELVEKAEQLPKDIRWHFIGHLQTNKVKLIVPFIYLIHGVDSLKLLKEIDKQAEKNTRVIDCLLQVHIAQEETKFGFDETELLNLELKQFSNVRIKGLMGIASLTDEVNKIRVEFKFLKNLFKKLRTQHPELAILSMGMSADYKIAIEEGSNMVRIGSLLFGERNYQK